MKHLVDSATRMRPFLPAKDFELSKKFYLDLGFSIAHDSQEVAGMALGDFEFLLQNFFVKELAENFMMHLIVSDVGAWWDNVQKLDLAAKYGVKEPVAPKEEPWGFKILYVTDPSGVLWHIAEPVGSSA